MGLSPTGVSRLGSLEDVITHGHSEQKDYGSVLGYEKDLFTDLLESLVHP